MKKFDLEERLIDFAIQAIDITEALPRNPVCKHLGSNQLLRSSTSPALNYGEAQAAESRADFIHKIKVVLKELRESFVCLKILNRKKYLPDNAFAPILRENNELISIFVKTLKTAKENLRKF